MKMYILSFLLVFLSCTSNGNGDPLQGLHKMSLEEQSKNGVSLNASIPAYTQDGKKIEKKDWGQYVMDSGYEKDFYADGKGILKAVIFRKKEYVETTELKKTDENVEGKPAFEIDATDVEGNRVKLSELKGKVVVLNFWFINCKPCVMEMPDLNALKKEFQDDVVFLSVTFDEKESVRIFLKQTPFYFTVLPDAGDVCRQWNVNAYPTNVVIDQKGIIRLLKVGFDRNIKKVLADEIRQLQKV